MGGSASSLFDGFPISLSNVKKFGSGIGDKFPSANNFRKFGSGIGDKLPSWNNIQSFGSSIGKHVGNIASKTGKALTSNKARGITEDVAIGVGKEIIKNELRRINPLRPVRGPSLVSRIFRKSNSYKNKPSSTSTSTSNELNYQPQQPQPQQQQPSPQQEQAPQPPQQEEVIRGGKIKKSSENKKKPSENKKKPSKK